MYWQALRDTYTAIHEAVNMGLPHLADMLRAERDRLNALLIAEQEQENGYY